jgi:hypothetical protein
MMGYLTLGDLPPDTVVGLAGPAHPPEDTHRSEGSRAFQFPIVPINDQTSSRLTGLPPLFDSSTYRRSAGPRLTSIGFLEP